METTDQTAANDSAPATQAAAEVPEGYRQQYLSETHRYAGINYGPGLVHVPDAFPQGSEDEQRLTEDASMLAAFRANREAFAAWQQAKMDGVTNDAGLAQPISGEANVPATQTGSNHGAQTGVVDAGSVPDGAASNQKGDALNPNTPATRAAGTSTGVGTSTKTSRA